MPSYVQPYPQVKKLKSRQIFILFVFLCLLETPGREEDSQADTSFSDSSLFAHWGQDLAPDNRRVALKMFQYYGYNGYLSDRLSLDRPIPDLRPDG